MRPVTGRTMRGTMGPTAGWMVRAIMGRAKRPMVRGTKRPVVCRTMGQTVRAMMGPAMGRTVRRTVGRIAGRTMGPTARPATEGTAEGTMGPVCRWVGECHSLTVSCISLIEPEKCSARPGRTKGAWERILDCPPLCLGVFVVEFWFGSKPSAESA